MIVAVVGKGRRCRPEVADAATVVGRQVAEAGHILACGGLGGVMEAAAEGAAAVGGTVLGIVPGAEAGNPYCTFVVRTGLPATVRNVVVGSCCDALIALAGSHGTMQEIAVALDRGVPVVAVETDQWGLLVPETLPQQGVRSWLARVLPDHDTRTHVSAAAGAIPPPGPTS